MSGSRSLLYECALITGASGGLGEEFAHQLAPHCRRLVLVARREEALKQLETRLRFQEPCLHPNDQVGCAL